MNKIVLSILIIFSLSNSTDANQDVEELLQKQLNFYNALDSESISEKEAGNLQQLLNFDPSNEYARNALDWKDHILDKKIETSLKILELKMNKNNLVNPNYSQNNENLNLPITNYEQLYFDGYICSDDCSGHIAGFKWAKEMEYVYGYLDETYCVNPSISFQEGCNSYLNSYDGNLPQITNIRDEERKNFMKRKQEAIKSNQVKKELINPQNYKNVFDEIEEINKLRTLEIESKRGLSSSQINSMIYKRRSVYETYVQEFITPSWKALKKEDSSVFELIKNIVKLVLNSIKGIFIAGDEDLQRVVNYENKEKVQSLEDIGIVNKGTVKRLFK